VRLLDRLCCRDEGSAGYCTCIQGHEQKVTKLGVVVVAVSFTLASHDGHDEYEQKSMRRLQG
jgi:hypothetical protein